MFYFWRKDDETVDYELNIENPLAKLVFFPFVHVYIIMSFNLVHNTANLHIANALS
jgi:hypothetical protein